MTSLPDGFRRAARTRTETLRAGSLRTVSLRRRVTASSLLVLAAVLLAVGVLTDVLVAAQTRSDLQSRLEGRAATAVQLAGQGVRGAELVRRVDGPGVRVTLTTTTGAVYTSSGQGVGPGPDRDGPPSRRGGNGAGGDGPNGGGASGGGREADRVVRATLADGSVIVLSADSDQISSAQQRLRRILLALGVAGLVAAGLVTLLTTRLALAPLDDMTGLARSITRGDRGARLAPARTDTELGRAAAAFDDMLDELEGAESTARASEARTRQFVADAAHELRTPLAGVRAAAEAALDPELPAADRDRLHLLLLRDTQRAARLVDDLLALARIDAGIELHPVPVDLLDLARGEVERAGLLAPGLDVRATGDAVLVPGDPQRLGQVLANLLDNARRHTPDGGTITVAVTGPGSVTVTDTGAGVPEADRERIFERLVRLDDARSADAGGAGLGLAIARGIARAHGGELTCVDPPPGAGAAFRLTLPAGPS
ncbi:signal transduction histidine kinase [Pseudonocardia sediminis]|uniref:histidine kinase n=1 Tax=Pseudonocardia sediminis TaxID=1397368 RepID=A0A4Q7UTN4_PSEST|nr:HAMP domain-containing sensor histidine kinase [Pseudonocardia sediminis]RZT84151.1 signal transduction histidine kinase [Pseudonocardia sediminis]